MNTRTLEYLLVIAEEKNISKAADRLYCSQPSLSRQLQKVERDLGAKLFTRVHGQLLLTDAGKIYMNNAKAILYTEHKLEQDMESLRNGRKETVRLIIDPYLYFFVSRRIIPVFEKAYPEYKLAVSEGSKNVAVETVKSGMADMALHISDEQLDQALDYRMLHYEEYVFIAPRVMTGSPEAELFPQLGPAAFGEHCFLLERNDNIFRTLQNNILRYFDFNPRLVYEVGDPTAALQMVINGNGVTFTTDAKALGSAQDLLILPVKPAFTSSLYVAYPKGELLQTPAKRLLKIITEQTCSLDKYISDIHP